jgi:hypothetical protein
MFNQRGDWLLVVLLALQPLGAAAPSGDNPSAALIALENQWIEALEKSDINSLSKLFAANFIDTDETGHRSSKASVHRSKYRWHGRSSRCSQMS